jgi:hypothetical protein
MQITIKDAGTFAQGSFGLRDINRANGVDRGPMIRVWHVIGDGVRLDSFLSRQAARDAAATFARYPDATAELAALRRRHADADRLAADIARR